MSKYTTELRYLCETLSGMRESGGLSTVTYTIQNSRQLIFDFDYPIFDNNYKEELETKIIRHFYTREICEETVGLWKLRLEDKMNMIMPYYNQLYESALIKFNPLIDTEYSISHKGEHDESEVGAGIDNNKYKYGKNSGRNIDYKDAATRISRDTNNGTDYNLFSDTPEGGIDGIELLQAEHSMYLTDARKLTTNSVSTNNGTDESKKTGSEVNTTSGEDNSERSYNNNTSKSGGDSYIDIITGKRNGVSMSKMLKEFRETFINIDKMIINELESLFFMLW